MPFSERKLLDLRQEAIETEALSTEPRLSAQKARDRFDRIKGDYQDAGRDVALLSPDATGKTFRTAVMQAAAAYEGYLRELKSTPWPARAQPYVDNYLELATTKGRALYAKWKTARSLADLQADPQVLQDTHELQQAESLMRVHLGA